MNTNVTGIVSEIERYAVNDGPGIRTVVFLKGCPLRCQWCANPETQVITPQVMYWQARCIGCKMCVDQCPHRALRWGETGIVVDRESCRACGRCTEICNSQALTMAGHKYSVKEVLEEVLKDKPFFDTSGGGVTFSGGEATSQRDFLLALAKSCKEAGLHTCIETCGYAKWEVFESILPYIDIFLFDIKAIDDDVHRKFTGVSNQLILENLSKLKAHGANVVVRIPTIPGVNNTRENFLGTVEFLKKQPSSSPVSLLPYHRLGASKYEKLDMDYDMADLEPPSNEEMQQYAELFTSNGFSTSIGE